jgi:hypothetical protein
MSTPQTPWSGAAYTRRAPDNRRYARLQPPRRSVGCGAISGNLSCRHLGAMSAGTAGSATCRRFVRPEGSAEFEAVQKQSPADQFHGADCGIDQAEVSRAWVQHDCPRARSRLSQARGRRRSAIAWSAGRPRTRLPAGSVPVGTAEAAKASTRNRAETTCCGTWRPAWAPDRPARHPHPAPGMPTAKPPSPQARLRPAGTRWQWQGGCSFPGLLPCWCCGV